MNKLPIETCTKILAMLCEGSSMRSVARVCDVSFNTVAKLRVEAGEGFCGLARRDRAGCEVSLRAEPQGISPAMPSGVSIPKLGKRGPYKKKAA